MTPQIALDLSLDGIAVLSRADGGVWWREGVVRLDAPDMAEGLTRLRARCAARVGEDFTSILIIPESQLLFTSLERDDRDPKVTIRSLLRGRTPYEVEDLAFDYVQKGDRLQVAVVALETLMEAEEFAAGFGFRPVVIMGDTGDMTYPGRPHFGQTGIAAEFLEGANLLLDLEDEFEVIPAPAPPEMAQEETPEPVEDPSVAEAPVATPSTETTEKSVPVDALPEVKAEPAAPTPVTPTPVDAAPEASTPETFEDALAVAEALASPPPVSEPEPETAPPTETRPEPAMPAFSTRRRGQPPLGSKPAEPSLTRIAPRLAAPITPEQPKTATPTATKASSATLADRAPPEAAKAPEPASVAEAPELADPPADTKPTKPTVAASGTRPDAPAAPQTGKALEDIDAVALSLPGLAREKAVQPRRSGTARLGVYLTLSLLALMGVIAVWSVMMKGAPTKDGPASAALAPASEETVAQFPRATIPPADLPADQDVADLLPSTEDSGDRTAGSDLARPPLPITTPRVPAQDTSERTEPERTTVDDVIEPTPIPPNPDDGQTAQTNAASAPEVPETVEIEGNFEGTPALTEGLLAQETDDTVIASVEAERPLGEPSPLPPATEQDETPVAAPPATPSTDETETTSEPVVEPSPEAEASSSAEEPASEPDATVEPLVPPTEEGTVAPGGYTVIAGRPDVMPTRRADDTTPADVETVPTPEDDAARAELRRTRPAQRPGDAIPQEAEATTEAETPPPMASGFTREELTRTRPLQRPDSITDAAAREAEEAARAAVLAAAAQERAAVVEAAAAAAVASLASQATTESTTAGQVTSSSRLAISQSDRPRSRPRSVEREAARIVTSRRAQTSAAPAAASTASVASEETVPTAQRSGQTIRSAGGSVARAATQRNAIRLREINLVGVYGRPNARRALVRLSNGRYVKVEVGDRLDRGRVTAIGDSQLVYQRSGRSVSLRLPNS
ncbi:hypothetical protein SAMN05444004_10817 [Jannaschia faecimaris]|uniref:Type IV pilus biogenesis protein PilP n=1 Tax=Jannaschia faecimaris TaxID=1244108 RepID=A0A1H3RAG8_9RHOB|nr:hypothetical protein [Jannaschia faecimaris]SDZ22241.1 hypothetical protein SAMN05444004_10817 [Jannaschia faecimaris]